MESSASTFRCDEFINLDDLESQYMLLWLNGMLYLRTSER